MEAGSATGRRALWRLWALAPILLLALAVGLLAARSDSIFALIGHSPPSADTFDIRRVEFRPGELRIHVRNPQRDDLTIGSVTVDDAIVPFTVDGPKTLSRLRSSAIVVAYDWVADDPIAVGVTSSTGIETTKDIGAAVETPVPSGRSFLGYGLLGLLVGVVPVALGLLWLPSLRRADRRWLAAFMALTAGLLSFLGVEALFEAFQLQAALPSAFGGAGLILLGVALSARHDLSLRPPRSRPRGRKRPRACTAGRGRDRRPQPRRRARNRYVLRRWRAPARNLPRDRLHDPQRHRRPRHRHSRVRRTSVDPALAGLALVAGGANPRRRLDWRRPSDERLARCSSLPSQPALPCKSSSRSAASSPAALRAGSAPDGPSAAT